MGSTTHRIRHHNIYKHTYKSFDSNFAYKIEMKSISYHDMDNDQPHKVNIKHINNCDASPRGTCLEIDRVRET